MADMAQVPLPIVWSQPPVSQNHRVIPDESKCKPHPAPQPEVAPPQPFNKRVTRCVATGTTPKNVLSFQSTRSDHPRKCFQRKATFINHRIHEAPLQSNVLNTQHLRRLDPRHHILSTYQHHHRNMSHTQQSPRTHHSRTNFSSW
jgi:hypothetical protein